MGFEVSAMKRWWLASCVFLSAAAATAHVNDRGMDYEKYRNSKGQSCCDNRDCRPAKDFVETVVNGHALVRLLIDGTWITVSRFHINPDPASDGRAHWCGRLELIYGRPAMAQPDPVCVILPPRST
jgi:hypothetical protein